MKIQYQSTQLTIFESALYRTTTTLVDLETCVLIVDPNWLPIEIETIKNFINDRYFQHDVYILFTHADFDHIIGYGAFPEAKVIAGKDFVENPWKEKSIRQIIDFDDSYYIQRPYPVSYPQVDIVINKDGQKLVLGEDEIVFYFAKGHVNNGLIAVCPQKELCIAGDYLSNIEIPMVEYSFNEYFNTLSRFNTLLDTYTINQLVTGHGDKAMSEKDIRKRIQEDSSYIDAFLTDFNPENPIFENVIQSKGNIGQNQIIHQNNINFFAL